MPNPPLADTITVRAETLEKLKAACTVSVAPLPNIPARRETDPLDAFREPDHPQRGAVEGRTEGSDLVIVLS